MLHRLPRPALPTLPTLALAAAVALLALAAAHAFWRVAAPLPITAPAAATTTAGLASPGLDALFGEAAAAPRPAAGTLRLVGVIAEGDAGNDSGVALIAADGQPVRAYRRGDTLAGSAGQAAGEAAGAPRVERIEARRVRLSDGGELTLPAGARR